MDGLKSVGAKRRTPWPPTDLSRPQSPAARPGAGPPEARGQGYKALVSTQQGQNSAPSPACSPGEVWAELPEGGASWTWAGRWPRAQRLQLLSVWEPSLRTQRLRVRGWEIAGPLRDDGSYRGQRPGVLHLHKETESPGHTGRGAALGASGCSKSRRFLPRGRWPSVVAGFSASTSEPPTSSAWRLLVSSASPAALGHYRRTPWAAPGAWL